MGASVVSYLRVQGISHESCRCHTAVVAYGSKLASVTCEQLEHVRKCRTHGHESPPLGWCEVLTFIHYPGVVLSQRPWCKIELFEGVERAVKVINSGTFVALPAPTVDIRKKPCR